MKLKSIYETEDTEEALELLGSTAKQTFKTNSKLPSRYTRRSKKQANCHEQSPRKQKCQDCKYFDIRPDNMHRCKIVEGNISANGWCQYWDK